MKTMQKVLSGVVISVTLATVAVLGRPYLLQTLTSLQHRRALAALAAEYKSALRDVDRKADEIGTAFFESKRDYFVSQVDQVGYSESLANGVLNSLLQTTKKVTAMELRLYAARQYLIKLRSVGAQHEATLLREDLDDQTKDNKEVYARRMRQSDFPIDDLLAHLRHTLSKSV